MRAKFEDVDGTVSAEHVGNISLMRVGGEGELRRLAT